MTSIAPFLFPSVELGQLLVPLAADMQQAQLLMLAGFVMLGWVLARRQLKFRKRVNRDARTANKAIQRIREHKEPAVPLCDAPVETQRWQVAMFDLQRELKAELDTRIVVVQTLLRQVDQRIERLAKLETAPASADTGPRAVADVRQSDAVRQTDIERMFRKGHTASEISAEMELPLGEVELVISTIRLT